MNVNLKYFFYLYILFAQANLTAQTYTKNIGYEAVEDGATSIANSKDGFFISGYTNNYTYLKELH